MIKIVVLSSVLKKYTEINFSHTIKYYIKKKNSMFNI